MSEPNAQVDDIRLVAMMMDTFMQVWAGKLGAGPQSGSPLEKDLAEETNYATERLTIPMQQAWTFAQTVGLAATNHETILRESLLQNANGKGSRPVTVVDTLTRVIVELLSIQTWLVDPQLTTRERFMRWIALETDAVRAQWKMTNIGLAHDLNPILNELAEDAEVLGVEVAKVPAATELVGQLFQKAVLYVPFAATTPTVGSLIYRLLSGAVHGDVAQVLATLLPRGKSHGELPIMTYSLSASSLWRAATVYFLTSYVARSSYAEWLGIKVPDETRRLSLHHIKHSVDRLDH